jgi:ribosomal-protein-alanine N-acetyltransferase
MHPLPLDLPGELRTERLVLRCYRAGDGRWYAPMSARNREHLARFEAGNPVMGISGEADAEAVLRDFADAWAARRAFFFGCFRRDDDAFVGQLYIGLVSRELPEFEIGYFADREHTGRGYISEATRAGLDFCFTHLRAERVRLECDDTNEPSIRVAERCGFVREGHLRRNRRWPGGTLSGTLLFGMLRDEWASRRPLTPSGDRVDGAERHGASRTSG